MPMRLPLLAVALAGVVVVSSFAVALDLVRLPSPGPTNDALETDQVPVPRGAIPALLAGSSRIAITLTLTGADPTGLAEFLTAVQAPASPEYHHFLDAAQFEARFSPTAAEAASVAGALASDGATHVAIAPSRLTVSGELSAARVDALFGIELVRVGGTAERPLYTSVGAPSLPGPLAGRVTGIGGLSDTNPAGLSLGLARGAPIALATSGSAPAFISGNTSGAQWFIGSDYTQVLGASELFPGSGARNATFPTHVAVATLLVSGYNESTGTDLPPWQPAAIDWYLNHTLGPAWPISNLTGVPVDYQGVTPPLPGPNDGLNDTSDDQIENSLDLEMAASVAPGAPIYNFYVAGSAVENENDLGDLADAFALELSTALSYDYGAARLGAVSASFGLPDTNDSAWNAALQMAAGMGVTVVAASGDQGNAPDSLTDRPDGQWPTWPATAAFNTSGSIAVGGVTLNVSGGTAGWYNDSGFVIGFDRNLTGIQSVVTWYDTTEGPGGIAGSEGGLSAQIPEPFWQFHSAAQPPIAAAGGVQGTSFLGRAEPDVALPANYTIIATAENSTGAVTGYLVSGTSIAAPSFAGMLAEIVAVRSGNSIGGGWSPLGFLDPTLYRIGSYFAAFPSGNTDPFLDVTKGSNYVFAAAPGWDPTTGWGVPNATLLLATLGDPTVTNYTYTGPTPGLASNPGPTIPWLDIWIIFGIGLTAAVVLILVMARPSRRVPATVPWGAQTGRPPTYAPGPNAPPYGGATFLCPYCGAVRPAEPVRCPTCGAY
jgi:subtilase family serine protease